MDKINLLIAEDECIPRMALARLLVSSENYLVVGETGNGHDLVEMYLNTKPDVVLCDITMPLLNGLEASAKILKNDNNARIILFTMHDEDDYLLGAIKIGVSGYVSKFMVEANLREAINSVHTGGTYFMGKTDEEIKLIKTRCCNRGMAGKLDELTKREKEIMHLLVVGMTSNEIAERLFISKRTVDCHRAAIKEKLGISKRSEIVDLIKK